jgi:two-component system chemotaxis sensor kinase CheA
LGKFFGDVEGISGATITGDGSIVLILDPVGLVRRFVGVF